MKGKGKGKNFEARHQKGLVHPASKPQPSKPRITLEQIQAKRNVKPNQALIDADAAENLALSLLQVCADTTEQFAALAQGDDKVACAGTGAGAIKETALTSSSNTTSTSSTNSITSSDSKGEQDRIEMIRMNGNLIQTKLKQIHELLATHAHLIVNYSHEQCKPKPSEEEEDSDEQNGEGKDNESNQEGDAMTSQDEKKKEDEKKEDQNMYSSRLEMRLAIERRNLLRDLLKLEKQRQLRKSTTDCTDMGTVDNSSKRKREDWLHKLLYYNRKHSIIVIE